ncbi:MAG: hypothetical protein V4591_09275 [Bdellovibrionota bacterium]
MSTAKKIPIRLENSTFGSVKEIELDNEQLQYWENVKENIIKNKLELIENISDWREKNHVGVNQFRKKMDLSSKQYYRIMDKEENITLMTMAELAVLLGKKLKITFE